MSTRDENIRLRIEAYSEIPLVSAEYRELIALTQRHLEATQQAALSARTNSLQEVSAIQGITSALKEQQASQRRTSDDTAAGLQKVSDGYKTLNDSVRSFTSLVGTAFTLNEIKNFGLGVIEAKTNVDSLRIALTTMLGSRREADDLYAKVVNLAKSTPFSLAEVGEQVAKLKAYNIATEDLIPTITALGNMAAAVGKEKLPQLTLAYGQIANTGRLMGTELKQLTEAGIPAMDLLATSMGKTKDEVIKLQAAHAITFADVRKAFLDASEAGGKYAGLMANVSKTVGGQISNLADAYDIAKARIGNFFEDQIKSGTRIMGELVETLLGSESAIKRTTLAIASAVTVFTTFRVATTAQALATAAMSGAQGAGALIAGTYNLVMLTLKGTTEGLTRAQLESAVAARSSFAVIAANPVGAFVAVVGLAIGAILAWKAAQEDISVTMGQQEFDLRKGQDEINRMVTAATNLKDTDVRRKAALQDLIAKYPEYFSGINTEKITNDQLRGILDEVNKSYSSRIALAKEAYTVEKLNENRRKIWDEEEASIARLVKRVPELKQFGNDAAGVLNYLQQNAEANFKARNATDANSYLDYITNGNSVVTLEKLKKNLDTVEVELKASDARVLTATAKNREVDIANTHAYYARLIKDAGTNKSEIARLKQEEIDAVDKLNGTYRKKELVDTGDHAEKTKQIMLFSAKEQAALLKGVYAQTVEERIKALDAEEAAEKEHIVKITVNRKISNEQVAALREDGEKKLLAVQAKYQALREVLEKEAEELKFEAYLNKARETEDKITLLKKQQLEAQKILDKLNAAQTFDERLVLFREYGTKIGDELKIQAVEELKVQRDISLKKLEEVRAEKGVLSQAYRDAHAQYLKDVQQYETASLQLTKDSTQTKLKAIEDAEKQIQEARKETAKITKEIAKIETDSQKEVLTGWLGLASQADGVFGQIAGGLKLAVNLFGGLRNEAVATAKAVLKDAEDALTGIKGMYDKGTAEGAAAIAKGEEDVAKAKKGVSEAQALSADAALSLFSTIYQIASAIAAAFNGMMAETNKAIAEGLGKTREAYSNLYDFIQTRNKDNLDRQLADAEGNFAERERLIASYYAAEKALIADRSRIDIQLAYNQEMAASAAEAGGNVKKSIEGMIEAQKNYYLNVEQQVIRQAELELQRAADVRDAKIAFIDAALQKFTEAIDAEIAKEQAGLDARKAANEQYYSDKQLRLLNDDVYRAQLLAQGEAREIAALEAAKAREIQRAIESGATQEELARITIAFDTLIAEKHAEYSDAIGNKTKETSLANAEAKAQEKDTVNTLENTSAATITGLQNQIKQQEIQAAADKKAANEDYANAVMKASKEVFEANRRMKVAELQAEIAILRSKRNVFNQGKIDAAIGDLNEAIGSINGINFDTGQVSLGGAISGAINQLFTSLGISNKVVRVDNGAAPGVVFDSKGNPLELTYNSSGKVITVYGSDGKPFQVAYADGFVPKTGERLFKGTPYLQGLGYPDGVDTVPTMLTKGERVLSTEHNAALSGITNEDVVGRVSFYEKFASEFPQLLDPTRWSDIAYTTMQLPAGVMNSNGGQTVDLSLLRGDLQAFRTDLRNLKQVNVNVDKGGLSTIVREGNSKTQYYDNLFNH